MHTISTADAFEFINHVGFGLREPIMMWGQPGVGKSDLVSQVAAHHNAVLVDIRLSQYDSVDLRGIPSPDTATGLTVWFAPATLPFVGNPAFATDRPILLFLDEINAAQPSVAAVAYQLIHDRAVGEHKLLPNVVIVAAGNRETDRGVTNRQPLPLANRFTHIEIGVDVDAWCAWAQDAGLPMIGIAFMQFRKPLLSTFDPAKPDKAFATPRTWAKALRYFASSMPDSVRHAAMAGAIGDGPAAEFWGFAEVWQNILKPSQIIADPLGVKLPDELSTLYATTVSVSGAMNTQTVAPLNQFLMRLSDSNPELVVLAWQLAARRDKSLLATPAFLAYAKQFKSLI